MARISFSVKQPMVNFLAIVPDYAQTAIYTKGGFERKNKLPVLWLFHDLGGNCESWTRFTNLEYLVNERNLVIICPTAGNSYYTNWEFGLSWFSTIYTSLWDYVHSTFPTSDRPEDNFIAGAGVGGYGALLYALTEGRYSFAASFSGDLEAPVRYAAKDLTGFPGSKVFEGSAEEAGNGKYNLMHLLETCPNKPSLYLSWTGEQGLHRANLRFADRAKELGYSVISCHVEGSDDWDFRGAEMKKVLDIIKTM